LGLGYFSFSSWRPHQWIDGTLRQGACGLHQHARNSVSYTLGRFIRCLRFEAVSMYVLQSLPSPPRLRSEFSIQCQVRRGVLKFRPEARPVLLYSNAQPHKHS